MREFTGKTAFVSGAASGIGFALAKSLALAGASVMLCDIEEEALATAVSELGTIGPRVDGVLCDVADYDDYQRAAERTLDRFGVVHILCNNAGVSRAGSIEKIAEHDWNWVVGVNLMGVVHGIQAFLPRMKASSEECHIVNTSSMAGVVPRALSGPYGTTKAGIIALTDVLADELEETNIGVSVLCPSWVRTKMPHNGRNRPERFGGPFDLASDTDNAERNARYLAAAELGLDPMEVAAMVLDAIRGRRRFIFTHNEARADVEAYQALIQAGFDAADAWARSRTSLATDATR
ncbi:MAG TPA: SDR family NAD(P)-dependent oxidoreductase [Acidimicrobiales bacterium]